MKFCPPSWTVPSVESCRLQETSQRPLSGPLPLPHSCSSSDYQDFCWASQSFKFNTLTPPSSPWDSQVQLEMPLSLFPASSWKNLHSLRSRLGYPKSTRKVSWDFDRCFRWHFVSITFYGRVGVPCMAAKWDEFYSSVARTSWSKRFSSICRFLGWSRWNLNQCPRSGLANDSGSEVMLASSTTFSDLSLEASDTLPYTSVACSDPKTPKEP